MKISWSRNSGSLSDECKSMNCGKVLACNSSIVFWQQGKLTCPPETERISACELASLSTRSSGPIKSSSSMKSCTCLQFFNCISGAKTSSPLDRVLKVSSSITLFKHLGFHFIESAISICKEALPAKGPSSTHPVVADPLPPKARRMGEAVNDVLDAGLSNVQSQYV